MFKTDEVRLGRLGLEGSDADSEDVVGEGIDEAQKTRRYMKGEKVWFWGWGEYWPGELLDGCKQKWWCQGLRGG